MADALDLSSWKNAAQAGSTPADARLLKTYAPDLIKAEGGEDSRQLTFTISTGAVDRDRDTLAVAGWDVQDYLKNPVLLWAHDSDELPIGRAVAVVKRGSALHATFEFAPADIHPFADQVFRLLKAGFLKAVSVGFMPLEWAYDEARGGFNFLKQSLLEVSVVPVPSNPQALLEAKRAGIETGLVKAWAQELLDSGTEPPPVPPDEESADTRNTVPDPGTTVPKAGRVLSAANHERVKAAHDACMRACSHLQEVMDGAGMDGEEEPKAAPPVVPKEAEPTPRRISVKRSTAPAESTEERIKRVVKAQVVAEIRRLTGRLD